MPTPSHKKYTFPPNVYLESVERPYEILGRVRAKVDYETLDANREEKDLCRNYYKKAATELLELAKKKGGDAVLEVRSVVFLVDGRTENYKTPECSDDGAEGQVLLQGIAVKWKPDPPKPEKAKLKSSVQK